MSLQSASPLIKLVLTEQPWNTVQNKTENECQPAIQWLSSWRLYNQMQIICNLTSKLGAIIDISSSWYNCCYYYVVQTKQIKWKGWVGSLLSTSSHNNERSLFLLEIFMYVVSSVYSILYWNRRPERPWYFEVSPELP